ncbi:MAG: metallophosphoesterase [archaeon]
MKIGIVSDIHEDVNSLKKAFKVLHKEKCSHLVCLGDFTGYCVPYYGFLRSRNAHKVISLLRKTNAVTLVGNHDLFSIRKLPVHKAGFPYPKSWYSLDYRTRKKQSKGKIFLYENNELSALLTKDDKKFIRQLPEYIVKKYGDLKLLFSHYAFPDVTGSTTREPKKPKDVQKHFSFMKKQGCTIGISGHDHKEGMLVFSEKTVRKIPFNKTIRLTNNLTWLHGPSVANGSFANGVLVLDTDKEEILAIPLKSKKHVPPAWRKL